MVHAIEFGGRLCRPDGRAAPHGRVDLCFSLHPSEVSRTVLWEEIHRGVHVSATGAFSVALGANATLDPSLFEAGPLFVSVRPVQNERIGDELYERLVLAGAALQPAEAITELEARLDAVEGRSRAVAVALRRTRVLRRHVRNLERGSGPFLALNARMEAIEARLGRLDAEEGRVTHLEDELEDIVGPDGDVVDLLERIEALERRSQALDRLADLEARLAALETRLNTGR